jgi:hypothetical protein
MQPTLSAGVRDVTAGDATCLHMEAAEAPLDDASIKVV